VGVGVDEQLWNTVSIVLKARIGESVLRHGIAQHSAGEANRMETAP
jgi:hypothetical protein